MPRRDGTNLKYFFCLRKKSHVFNKNNRLQYKNLIFSAIVWFACFKNLPKNAPFFISTPRGELFLGGTALPEADIAALLDGEQLFDLLLDTAGNVLVHVHEADCVWGPEGQSKVLDGPAHREPGGRVLVARLQVIHPHSLTHSFMSVERSPLHPPSSLVFLPPLSLTKDGAQGLWVLHAVSLYSLLAAGRAVEGGCVCLCDGGPSLRPRGQL